MTEITLAVLDLAGTTVSDDGIVEQAFADAYDATTVLHGYGSRDAVREFATQTMGQSKIAVFRELTATESDAETANLAFERAYTALVATGVCTALPGAEATIRTLRAADIHVALTTGFSPATQSALLDTLGWSDIADVALTPADAGRGRPFPDLNLVALLRTQTVSVAAMLVAGDTTSDMISATRAGAARAVGVLTGAHDSRSLQEAGATDILPSIAGLPALLGLTVVVPA